MSSEEVTLILVLPMTGIIAGVAVIIAAMRHRAKVLELVHKERVAMIERGIVPPELGPGGYDQQRRAAGTQSRSFSLGIIVVGIGLALMTLIGVAGEAPESAIGIGGAIAILGGAFIVRSLLTAPHAEAGPPVSTYPASVSSRSVPPAAFPPSDLPPSDPQNR